MNTKMRTHRLLWATCAFATFAVLAAFDPLPRGVKDGPISPWRWFANVLNDDTRAWALRISDQMLFYGLLLAVLAVALGWALQALIVAARAALPFIRSSARSSCGMK
jgi:hypothetical protein